MTTGTEIIPLYLTPGPPESLKLRFPPEYSNEIQALLDEHGIEHSMAGEFSAGVSLAIESIDIGVAALATIGGLGGLAAGLASIYKTFALRHRDKAVTLDAEGAIEVRGFSQKQTLQVIARLLQEQATRDAEWFRSIGHEPPKHHVDGGS